MLKTMLFAVPALALCSSLLQAQTPPLNPGNVGNSMIAPPQSEFRGQTYSEWSVAFNLWATSMPITKHPLFDTADCSEGQTGNVWFIAGKRGGAGPFPAGGRTCTISAGTALFLPLITSEYDNEACAANGIDIQRTSLTESQLRMEAYNDVTGYLSSRRRIVIDGVDVQGVPLCDPANPAACQSPYRVQSPVFNYTVPPLDNILTNDDGPCYDNLAAPYTVVGAVSEGLYVMIKPLPVGQHTIEFGNLTTKPRLYNITVVAGK